MSERTEIESALLRDDAAMGEAEKLAQPGADESGKPTKAKRAIGLALSESLELFHDPQRRGFARVKIETHFENLAVESRAFKLWLSGLFWKMTGDALARESLNTAADVLAAKAVNEGQARELHNRVAWHDGVLYYHLADAEWRVVRIDAAGWEIVNNPPVFFVGYPHQKPQAVPVHGGNWRRLYEFLNLDEGEQKLFVVVLVAYLLADVARPLAVLTGEHGSAKSTTLRIAREIIDPSAIPLLGAADLEELPQILAHHFCVPLDNVGRIDAALSDLLCRAVTGGGISKRKLYTDEDDVILTFKRAVMVNSINPIVNRPDLLDRSVLFNALPLAESRRKPEEEFWEAFERAKPEILGGLFGVLSEAMRLHQDLRIRYLPRMADFAVWGAAIAEAMGWGQEEFCKAYQADAARRNQNAIEVSLVAQCVIESLGANGTWEGTASELLNTLRPVASGLGIDDRSREWPKQPHVLSRRINELVPVLRMAGVEVSHAYRGKDRLIRLASGNAPETASEASVASESLENTSPYESTKSDATGGTDGIFSTLTRQGDFEL